MAIGCNRAGCKTWVLHCTLPFLSYRFNSSLLYFFLCTVEMTALTPFPWSNILKSAEREKHGRERQQNQLCAGCSPGTESQPSCARGTGHHTPSHTSSFTLWTASGFLRDTVFQKETCFLFNRDRFLRKETTVSHFSWADRNTAAQGQAELHQGVPEAAHSPARGMLNSHWGRGKGHCVFKGNTFASERGKELKKHL